MRNVVLTGFMGTGKTSVGREVARRLGCAFIDMDTVIEQWAGKPIPRIFADDGEAKFREMEAALCKNLSRRSGLVIATGGGSLVDPDNRETMVSSGTVICLTCHPAEILRRLDGATGRPLLDVNDPRVEINRLLELRREAYAAIPWHVDTTGLLLDTVVDEVMELAGIITLAVRHPHGRYDVHVGTDLLSHVADTLRRTGVPAGTRVAVVSPPGVAELYGEQVEDGLRAAEYRPASCPIPDGEENKTLATVSNLYDQFLEQGLDRRSVVLALGGGVTGDVTGFAAATYMRGIRLIQVPTTLLAMVDASIGGKTGVDLPQGKNLVGAFKQPTAVVIDPNVLASLTAEEIRSGLAEVIKHAIIGAPGLFTQLREEGGSLDTWWQQVGVERLAWALRVKIVIVEEDPFEEGRRAVLNLGHTVGHALEQLSDYSIRHGEAVAIGVVAAARISEQLGRAPTDVAASIESVISKWGLPVRCPPYRVDAILDAMAHDKKRQGRILRWVLPHEIGKVEIAHDVDPAVVREVLRSMDALP
jgi:3-dehydroquinate synthase